MTKQIHIEIKSSPFTILTDEIYKVLEFSLNGECRDKLPTIQSVKDNLKCGWSRFNEFEFDGNPIIDEELGYYEFTFVNGDEWVKYIEYFEDID